MANIVNLPLSLQHLLDRQRGCGVTLIVDLPLTDTSEDEAIGRILKEARFRVRDSSLVRINRDQAIALLSHLVAYDQAHGLPTDALPIAESCSIDFVSLFPPDSTFLTNSDAPIGSTNRAWTPVTDSTFDSGVIVVSSDCGGLFWFEDED